MSDHVQSPDQKDTVVVIGGTGACGKWVVDELLKSNDVEKVISMVRRPRVYKYERNSEKLHEVKLSDNFDHDLDQYFPTNASAAFACVGTTIKQAGSKEAFRSVDYDINTKFASTARSNNVPQFHLISSVGASPDSYFFYTQVKGEVEEYIKNLNFPHCAIYRPGPLSSSDREVSRGNEDFGVAMSRMFSWFDSPDSSLGKYAPVDVRDVAIAMVQDYTHTRQALIDRQTKIEPFLLLDGSMSIIHRARAAKKARGEADGIEHHLQRFSSS